MNEIIKKLKASTPTIVGEEASAYYDTVYSGRDKENSYVYHSAAHGFDATMKMIDSFLKTYAKIGPSDTEFIYSYQPYMIGHFSLADGNVEIMIWYMVYSNCIIAYYETADGKYSDISMVVNSKDLDEIIHGPQTSHI